jgi:hypothetical protein
MRTKADPPPPAVRLQGRCEKLCKPQDKQKLETVCLHGSPDLNATHKSRAAPLQNPLDAELCPRAIHHGL